MHARDIRLGQVLYWHNAQHWQLTITDDPKRAVTVMGTMSRWTYGVDGKTVVPARPQTGRIGVWCYSAHHDWHYILPLGHLRGVYADVIAGRITSDGVKLRDTQHYVVQLLANGGVLHRNAGEFKTYYVAHGKIGRVPVRTPTVQSLEKHGFIKLSNVERDWYAPYTYEFTTDGQAWYQLNPRKPGTLQ